MQREMRRRGGGFGFDEDRVQVFDAAGTFVPGPAPDVQGERVLAVGVVAVNEEDSRGASEAVAARTETATRPCWSSRGQASRAVPGR